MKKIMLLIITTLSLTSCYKEQCREAYNTINSNRDQNIYSIEQAYSNGLISEEQALSRIEDINKRADDDIKDLQDSNWNCD